MTCSAVDPRAPRLRSPTPFESRRPRAVAVARRATAPGAVAGRLPGPFLALLLLLALVLSSFGCSSAAARRAAAKPPYEAVEVERLINPRLSLNLSRWLVGPVAVMATEEEEEEYLALTSDEAAREFIEAFWERRDPYPLRPDNPLRETFDERAAEANRLYREGGRRGSQTARGTIYVLFGPPDRTDYQIAPDPLDPPIEVWYYDYERDEEGDPLAPPGLAGEPPAPWYGFIKRGDFTEFYSPRTGLDRPRVRPIR